MHPMLNIAVKAARTAGTVINRATLQGDSRQIERKQHNDFVTEVDRAAEATIIDIIKTAYPDHAILAEESGQSWADGETASENVWVIDPLDGTTNFIHGFPQYAVSIALMQRNVVTQAVVYDPTRDELFTASKGAGAFLNNRRIRVTRRDKLVVVYSSDGLNDSHNAKGCCCCGGNEITNGREINANILAYALLH